jgi:uncharacterized protein YggE
MVLAALVMGAAMPRVAVAQGTESVPTPPPEIVASGMGEARVSPDRAVVTVGVQSRAATAGAAARENARKVAAVLDTLRGMGLASDQLSTMNYSVYPEQRFDQQGQKPVVTGYVVQNMVRVEVRRIDQAGAVLDAALSRGANQVHSFDFFASNTDAPRRQALAEAVARARGDAEAAARAAGGSLGAMLGLMVGGGGVPMPRMDFASRRGVAGGVAMEAAAPTPVEPGQEVVRSFVTVRWQFVPGR